jgi:hypothetical protein
MQKHFFKLPWLQNTPTIKVTQGFHGDYDNGTGMDFTPEPLIAPMDGTKVVTVAGAGGGRWFEVSLPIYGTAIIRCVHGVPAKGKGQTFKRGEVVGYTVPFVNKNIRQDHWHIAIKVNNVWQGIMTYIDRKYKIQRIGSPWTNPYHQWSFYNDRTLAINVPTPPVVTSPTPAKDNEKPFVPAPEPEPQKELPPMESPVVVDDNALETNSPVESTNDKVKNMQEIADNFGVNAGQVTVEKPNVLDKYTGILKDKIDLTTEEYLKTRKEEAKLTDSQKYNDLKKDFEKVLEGAKKEKLDLEKVLIGLFKSGNPQSVISGGLAYILALLAGAGENTQISALVGSYVITLVAYGIRFILDKIKS